MRLGATGIMILNNRDFNSLNRFIEVFPEKEEEEEEGLLSSPLSPSGRKGGERREEEWERDSDRRSHPFRKMALC